jgi:hypothetical protein
MNDRDYLKMMLKDKQLKLEYLHMQIHIAVHESKKEMLISEIDSLERQLDKK